MHTPAFALLLRFLSVVVILAPPVPRRAAACSAIDPCRLSLCPRVDGIGLGHSEPAAVAGDVPFVVVDQVLRSPGRSFIVGTKLMTPGGSISRQVVIFWRGDYGGYAKHVFDVGMDGKVDCFGLHKRCPDTAGLTPDEVVQANGSPDCSSQAAAAGYDYCGGEPCEGACSIARHPHGQRAPVEFLALALLAVWRLGRAAGRQ